MSPSSPGGGMMINISCTSGAEVEGLRIKDPLVARLMGSLTDAQRAEACTKALQDILAIQLAYVEGIGIPDAVNEVAQLTDRIS